MNRRKQKNLKKRPKIGSSKVSQINPYLWKKDK